MKYSIKPYRLLLVVILALAFPASSSAQCVEELFLNITSVNHDGTCDIGDPGGPDPAIEIYIAGVLVFSNQWDNIPFAGVPENDIPIPPGPGDCGNGNSFSLGVIGQGQTGEILGVVIFESDDTSCDPYNAAVDDDHGAGTYNLVFNQATGTLDVGSCISFNYELTSVVSGSVSSMFTGPICPEESVEINGTTYNITNPTGTETIIGGAFEGCDSIVEVDLTFFSAPIPIIGGPTAVCPGASIVLSVSSSFISTEWSNGAMTPSIFVNSSGNYSVTVTDNNGCVGEDDVDITDGVNPNPVIMGPEGICPGDIIILDVGLGYSSYVWSNGSFISQTTVTSPGIYDVTVTNADGCDAVASFEVLPLVNPDPVITGPPSLCLGQTGILDAGPGFVTYLWSDGSSDQTLAINGPGIYEVTVTNGDGCDAVADFEVLADPGPMPVITGITAICAEDSTLLSVAGDFAAYLWSNGTMDSTALITGAGWHYVTVTDDMGCMGIDSIELTNLPAPDPLIVGDSIFCEGESGILEVIGGVFDSIYWSNGSILPITGVNDTDSISVEVFGSNGCVGLDTIFVEELSEDVTVVNIFTCNPVDTGVVINTFVNQDGCDSVEVTITELIDEVDTILINLTSCNIDDVGVFIDTYVNNVGCDVVEITDIDFALADTTVINQTTCDINEVGVEVDIFTNQFNCDSIVAIYTNYTPADTFLIFDFSCNPMDTGLVVNTFQNQGGCDSVEVIQTGLLEVPDTTFTLFGTCNPNSVGTVVLNLENEWGCDSTVIVDVFLLPTDTVSMEVFTCNPADTGTVVTIFENQFGCDSTTTFITTLLPGRDTFFVFESSCNPLDTGLFVEVYSNFFGCDSTVISTIDLVPSDTSYIDLSSCNPADTGLVINNFINQFGCDSLEFIYTDLLPGGDTTYTVFNSCNPQDTGTVIEVVPNFFGCDSTLVTIINLVETDSVYIELTSCEPADTGLVVNSFINQFGCDSVEYINTLLLPSSDTTFLIWESCSPADTGIFVQNLSNVFGCDSTVVIEVELLPTNFIVNTALSCNPLDTGSTINFFTNQFGCDSVVLTFTGLLPTSDTLYLEETTCIVQDTGLFMNTYANAFGCDSTVVLQVDYAASDSTYLFSSSCNPQDTGYFVSILINEEGCDSTIFEQVNFLPSDTLLTTTFTCNPGDTGTVVIALTNQFGCDSLIISEVLLEDPDICLVDASLIITPVTCFGDADGQLSFTVQIGLGPFAYELTGPFNQSGTINAVNESLNLFDLPPGNYQLVLISATDASASYNFSIPEPFELSGEIQVLSNFNGFEVSCSDAFDGSIQAIGVGGTTPYSYTWSNGATNSTLVGLPVGPIDLILEDANGCDISSNVVLTAPPPIEVDIDAIAVNCIEEETGQIRINNTEGGFSPYLYALNGNSFSGTIFYDSLPEGIYEITIQDALGCESQFITTIEEAADLLINAGVDTTIELGSTIELDPLTNQYNIVSVSWTPATTLSCSDCLEPIAAPVESTLYTVEMIDDRGCYGADSVLVKVFTLNNIYVPNIFSPNEDGFNEFLEVFPSQEVAIINNFAVYDRWGERVFQIQNVPKITDNNGWDGYFQGRPATQGVYVYLLEYTLKNGRAKHKTGSVTLVR